MFGARIRCFAKIAMFVFGGKFSARTFERETKLSLSSCGELRLFNINSFSFNIHRKCITI